jgi:hypothetical protein
LENCTGGKVTALTSEGGVVLDRQRALGLSNPAVRYLLVCRVGSFDLRKTQDVLLLGAGTLIMSVKGPWVLRGSFECAEIPRCLRS